MSATLYPGGFDTNDNLDQPGSSARSASMRKALDAVIAVETVLGLNPQGSAATVKERIASVESGETRQHAIVQTVGLQTVLAQSLTLPSNTLSLLEVRVIGKRSDGGLPMYGFCRVIQTCFKNTNGVVTSAFGGSFVMFDDADVGEISINIVGQDIQVSVIGDALALTMDWDVTTRLQQI